MKTKKQDNTKLVDCVTRMAVAFGKELDTDSMLAYVSCFDGFPIHKLTEGMAAALRTERFFPTPATVLSLAGLVVSADTRARIAFEALGKAVEGQGRYKSVQFDDPILTQTVKSMGGWEAVCDEPESNWHVHFKREFIAEYKANCERRRGSYAVLMGVADRVNGANGLERQEAVMIAVDLPQLPGIKLDKPRIAGPQVAGLLENIGKVV